jgi:chromosome partitioning protein
VTVRRTVFNQKGGVGKSTIVVNLAAVCATTGKSTLVVDLDPQANATRYLLGPDFEGDGPTLADFFAGTLSFRLFRDDPRRVVHASPFPRLHVAPAHPELADLAGKLDAHHKIYKLRELLDALPGFDRVFIDTPPAAGFYTLSALIAAERCLIPFDCDAFSRRAIDTLRDLIAEVRVDHNPRLAIEGIVINEFQSRALLPQALVDELVADGLPVLHPFISSSVKVRESRNACRPLVHLAPRHKLSGEFLALYRSLEGRRRRPSVDARRPVAVAG